MWRAAFTPETLPGKRGWRSPSQAVCTPPWPPWSPSCHCTLCPTPESRSFLPGPPHGPQRDYGRHLTEAKDRDGQMCPPVLCKSLLFVYDIKSYSLCCGSPWQEHYTWLLRLPRGCSPQSHGWSSTQSVTFQTQSTAPRSCGPARSLQANKHIRHIKNV